MHFLEESPTTPEKSHTLFVEKYRPTTLDDYITDEHIKKTFSDFIRRRDIPHLLLYGSDPGTGKTSLAKLVSKNIGADTLYINASDENGIENIRSKVKGFAANTGFGHLKVIILDESDFLSQESMGCLRNLIETFSLNTRFILTCNYHEKIIPPIVSRCQAFHIVPPSKKEIALHLKKILDAEKIQHTTDDIGFIVNTYYPDMRKMLNYAQQSILDNKLNIVSKKNENSDFKLKLLNLLKTPNQKTFNEIRQLIADADIRFFDECYKFLYDKISEFSKGNETLITITIAEHLYQSSLVVDKEITFMACIATILKNLK